jgi:putative transposase
MDGRGAWRDNVFVERLWRSAKYEEVYLRAYDSVGDARASLARYFIFYNTKRPHSSLDALTPEERFYYDHLPQAASLSVILCARHNRRQGGVSCRAKSGNWNAM